MFWRKKKISSSTAELKLLQSKLARKKLIEKAMVDIAPLFRSGENQDVAINKALQYLVRFSDCSRAYIMSRVDESTISMSHECCNRFVVPMKRFVQNQPYQEVGWFRDQTIDNGCIYVSDTKKVPESAGEEARAVFKKGRMRAMLAVSFGSQYRFGGTLCLGHGRPRQWDEDVVLFIQYVGSLIENMFERVEAEKKLNTALQQVSSNDELKSAFINNLSHEIRTPLNSIIGFSQLMANREMSESKRVELSKVIELNSNRLLNVMSDLLDIAQLDSHTMDIQKSDFSLFEFCQSLYGEFNARFIDKPEIQFVLDYDDDLRNVVVKNDEGRLRQIVQNLLDNSHKFTSEGSVVFYCHKRAKSIIIGVSDSGIGIEPQYFDKIFERFWQVNMNLNRTYGGNGLGLSLSRSIANELKVSLDFTSRLGKGSDFFLKLQQYDVIEKALPKVTVFTHPMSGKRLLVADDFLPIHEYVGEICKGVGVECDFVSNGEQAASLFRQRKYDAVLLDIKMPKMDGFAVLEKIKALDQDIVVIAQTAHDKETNKDAYLDNGFDELLVKPYKPKDLEDLLAKVLKPDYKVNESNGTNGK